MRVTVHAAANAALAHACEALCPASAEVSVAVTCVDSPLGPLLLGARQQSIAILEFCDASRFEHHVTRLQSRFGGALQATMVPTLEQLVEQLNAYFARSLRSFDLPLIYHGSSFQQQVWSELLRIPYGQTCSYGDIARRVGDSGAMRAVGMANHHNPIAIVIPCHRVVNAKGDIGGYGGEVWRKRWLLDLEAGQSQFEF